MFEKLRNAYGKRTIGYYFSAVITILALIMTIVYIAGYVGTDYMSWATFVALLVLFFVNSVLFLLGKNNWAPVVSVVFATVALCFYILNIYFYVSVVLVGIDITAFDTKFIVNTILLALLLVLSSTDIFLKQSK